MTHPPSLAFLAVEHGAFPEAPALNRRIPTGTPVLRATIEIAWDDASAAEVLPRLRAGLERFSPTFAAHRCGGDAAYRLGRGGLEAPRRGRARRAEGGRDPALAFAHLVEHLAIDLLIGVTSARRCSGVTAALAGPPGLYEVMIECDDFALGRCAIALAAAWSSWVATGGTLGTAERDIVEALRASLPPPAASARDRLAEADGGRGAAGNGFVTSLGVATRLGWEERRAEAALGALGEVGYLAPVPWALNFSGVASYRRVRLVETPPAPTAPEADPARPAP